MKGYGLEITDAQHDKVLQYLGTYLGPNPPKSQPAQQTASQQTSGADVDGSQVFANQCSACHQPDGKGVAGDFPPLAGNKDLFIDHLFPALVALNGLEGKIDVHGATYDGVMPPFGHLSDDKVAAVINYVRNAWGNADLGGESAAPMTTDEVKAAREKGLSSQQVHAYRAAHE
jgi:mono/diheme cytochrome c family protein